MELNRVYQGDCLLWMEGLGDESVDTVITDPPYSSGARRESEKHPWSKKMTRAARPWFGSDALTTNGFMWLMRSCALEWARVLKDGGHALVFIDWRMMPYLYTVLESANLTGNGVLVWDKTYYGLGVYFRNQYELILHFTKGKGAPPNRRDVGNVIPCKPIRNGSHPTEKPVELIKTLLSVVSPPGGLVLDCFAGTGAIGVAALESERMFLGCERERGYTDIANNRLCAVGAPVEVPHE